VVPSQHEARTLECEYMWSNKICLSLMLKCWKILCPSSPHKTDIDTILNQQSGLLTTVLDTRLTPVYSILLGQSAQVCSE